MDDLNAERRSLVIGIGEVLWDCWPDGKFLGGAPANFAFHAGQLGANGVVVSAIGSDDDGNEIEAEFGKRGLSVRYLSRTEYPTGTVEIVSDASGEPDYTICEDLAWDHLQDNESLDALAQRANAVCFGSLAQRAPTSRETIRQFLRRTRKDCLRVFDINLRQSFFTPETIHASLSLASVFKLNNEDDWRNTLSLLNLPGDEEASTVREIIDRYSLSLVALTRGGNGSTLYTRHRVSHHPGVPLSSPQPYPVGAGDAFTAALAVGLLNFHDLDAVHEHASRVASYVCSTPEAMPTLPDSLRTPAR